MPCIDRIRTNQQHVRGVKPGVDSQQLAKAVHEETGTDREHNRKRHLQNDQGLSKPSSGTCKCTCVLLQRRRDVDSGCPQGGDQPEEKRCEKRHGCGECKKANVGSEVEDNRIRSGRNEAHEHLCAPDGKRGTDETRDGGQQDVLVQHLPYEAPASRAGCQTDGKLALAGRATRQHEIGDVGARNQQDQYHQTHQCKER